MTAPLDDLAAALDALRSVGGDRAPGALTPAELMAVNESFGVARRLLDAAYAPIAAEIARQSRAELGRDSLARRQGFRTPASLISATTGATVGDAIRIVAVGEATAARMTLSGEKAPARRRHVAAALQTGVLGVNAASAICAMLERVEMRADRLAVDQMERALVEQCHGLAADQLQKLIARAEAHLDPDGLEPRDKDLRGKRGLSIVEDRWGMIRVEGVLDPESGAPVKAAVEGLVSGMLRRRDLDDAAGSGGGATEAIADQRSVKQMRADALVDLCRHALGCDQVPTAPSTTVVVRMSLDDLDSGHGVATIDGIGRPVSIGTARRMAGDAQVIPCILGGASEILDWGRAKRLFTPAQKLALAERDGGCAFCGLPPGMTAAHHIRWWRRDSGPTDLANGILLCTTCHHRIHDDGWEIRVDGPGTRMNVWFIPPPWIDVHRTPRLGGRARYDLAS
ncbi:DUF222 domain-containing protein [Microbacterium sp. P01]|uniref:DUF222 domain-containing protein n=1 Tax=Microbacterium sp. P01 TaxID=3366261 RepID=UPI00366DD287